MAQSWKAIGTQLGNLARQHGPRLLAELQKSGLLGGRGEAGKPKGTNPTRTVTPGRPVASTMVPTAHRARRVEYSPDLDGRADPGEVVWTWVAYEEDASQGKDRPVLVVGRDGGTLLGLMLSSNAGRGDERNWLGLGAGPWDEDGRPSWVRLDRVLDVPESGIRREGAVLDRKRFDKVAARLRSDYSWS
ncbi:type II toxin-antitoxin system PemK/MazF family toxin [Rhodococcus tukisamuensis]|uniref:PemK-like, MazF-like toxin of type II toxin-antitoxin system n=1 Tax=Rhodococcus tukisamuensis TaxID=168276 RepID=A0A1G7CYT5_9NOCA|nr:type II toxin-antitoxin system PemK/MazF family toxin [Rhodococcus tukisamuensis]SDE44403.1 PemK-like, MazF-like toxin of type II toxin-antitoxin system [Rhodococcus tukisamuensis]